MKNRFNRLTSKEWLPFQKSWFKIKNDELLYRENIRFFTKAEATDEKILYYGESYDLFKQIAEENNLTTNTLEANIERTQFILIDLRSEIDFQTTLIDYEFLRNKILKLIKSQIQWLDERRFVCVFIPNIQNQKNYFAFAWDIAKHISHVLSLKDEKIACGMDGQLSAKQDLFHPTHNMFYCLYFRKDEQAGNELNKMDFNFFKNNAQQTSKINFTKKIPYWFVLKPQPRKKDEILHPAKYPEELVKIFASVFTEENDNVFDPMTGTGSTQLGALKIKRNGYGTELSDFFAGIANARCKEYIDPAQQVLFGEEKNQRFKILKKDARLINDDDFPMIDYMITSPPYWDMLNMKGAENQAKRIRKGLKTNYSDAPDDVGNIQDYFKFLFTLRDIYFNISSLMKEGSFITIIVKNIKKKGSNYPFAWDLANLLQEKLILLPEVFWCQDDISIAPYGYGNTWVSNTFHQYCLNFQIPTNFKQENTD
jgi:DNA modification methylase